MSGARGTPASIVRTLPTCCVAFARTLASWSAAIATSVDVVGDSSKSDQCTTYTPPPGAGERGTPATVDGLLLGVIVCRAIDLDADHELGRSRRDRRLSAHDRS